MIYHDNDHMKITPEAKPIHEILQIEGSIIYKVPVYQRNYQWHPNNIEELFNDIVAEEKGYYVGNILVTPEQDSSGNKILSVVDGQQRLTTIALFFLAIYELIEEYVGTIDNKQLLRSALGIQNDISRK